MRKPVIVLTTAAVVPTLSGLRAADLWRWRTETLRTTDERAFTLAHIVSEYLVQSTRWPSWR